MHEYGVMGRFNFVSELSQEVNQVQGVRGSVVRPAGVVKLHDRPWPGDLDIVILMTSVYTNIITIVL